MPETGEPPRPLKITPPQAPYRVAHQNGASRTFRTLPHRGYRAEYGSLRLIVEQAEDSVKITVFAKLKQEPAWTGEAQTMRDAKDIALVEARKYLSGNPLANPQGLPHWEPYMDEISNL
jgi:hypothetical protein